MTYDPADSADTNHFLNVPWKVNGSSEEEEEVEEEGGRGWGCAVYCAAVSGPGWRSCSGTWSEALWT